MRRSLIALVCALALPLAAMAESSSWTRAIERTLASPGLRGAALSVLVIDADGGAELFARMPDQALVPASTQKLLTTAAAFATFGAGHRFVTEIRAEGELPALDTLYVRGSGDPALTSEQWWRLAADLRARGLERIAGDLVLDDTAFDDTRWHASWSPVSARAYHAPLSGLSANYGAFRVVVTPAARAGAPALVHIDPPVDYFTLESRAVTGLAGRAASLQVDRATTASGDRVVVRGSLPLAGEAVEVWRSVSWPTRYAGAVLRAQLQANGIALAGGVRFGPAPASARLLYEFEGLPLHHIADLCLKYSNNFIAESLLKALARAPRGASWEAGTLALRARLLELGLPLEGARLVDGSGLSRDNRVSARLLVAALRASERAFGFGPDLLAALPIAGEDGTLRRRADGARRQLRAKTGSLDGVTSLAGFARTESGRDVVFAVIANGLRNGDAAAAEAVDHFMEALIRDQ